MWMRNSVQKFILFSRSSRCSSLVRHSFVHVYWCSLLISLLRIFFLLRLWAVVSTNKYKILIFVSLVDQDAFDSYLLLLPFQFAHFFVIFFLLLFAASFIRSFSNVVYQIFFLLGIVIMSHAIVCACGFSRLNFFLSSFKYQ